MYKTNYLRALLLLVFSLTVYSLKGQIHLADSLENLLLEHTKEDTFRVNLLNETAWLLYSRDNEKCLKYAEEAEKLADKLSYDIGKATSSNVLGIHYYVKGNYSKALEYFHVAINMNEKIGNKKGVASCLNNIGAIHLISDSYEDALESFQKSLKIKQEIGDIKGIPSSYNNIGNAYMELGNYSKAQENYEKSLKLKEDLGDKNGIASSYDNIGLLYQEKGKLLEALEYFKKSLKITEELEDNYDVCLTCFDIGTVYFEMKNFTKALDYTLKSLKIATEHEFLDMQKDIRLQIAEIYESTNNYKNAYENYVIYKELSDTLFNEENIKKITGLEYQYKYEKEKQAIELEQQKKDAIQAEKNKRQTVVTHSSIAGFVLMILIVFLILRSYLQKQKTNRLLSIQNQKIEYKNKQLHEQNEEIQQLNEELGLSNEILFVQNEELEDHRNNLEKLVKERTADLEIAKEKAEESDRLKSAFLANMSHEIRTPMNAIVGFSNLLNDKELTDETKEEFTSKINHNSDTLLKLFNDIIDISKIESGQLKIKKEQCSVNEVFEKIVPLYNNKLAVLTNKQIEFFIKIPEKNIAVFTDRLRLQQILVNLIDNALKFTEKGKVEISIDDTKNRNDITFFVKDTGIGLTDKQKDIIFKRFTKVEDDRKKLYRGAGLGLAICKNLIELLGGKIWLESEENVGSTFYFSIPLS